MYKALHTPSGQDIIILDRHWAEQINYLRGLDKKEALVCPGCHQPVRVRAGNVKRWHFAHKHLGNCAFGGVSPTLLKIRAILYEWLVDQFGEEYVTLEKRLDSPAFHRPVDCWVEKGDQVFPYWLLDRRMPPDERNNLASGFQEMALSVQWVFAIYLLKTDEFRPRHRLHLTTTERAFIQTTSMDSAWQTHFEHLGGSLHYLDPDETLLTTYRNLTVVHLPQLYTGTRLQHPLAEVEVSNLTAEFIHPGEDNQRLKRQAEIEQQQVKAAERLRRAEEFFTPSSERKTPLPYQKGPSTGRTPFLREGTCRFCGTITTNWVRYNGETGECVCRDCKDRLILDD